MTLRIGRISSQAHTTGYSTSADLCLVNQTDEYGNTPLIRAAAEGDIENVRRFLGTEGIEINQQNNSNMTTLMMAAVRRKTKCVKMLQRGLSPL